MVAVGWAPYRFGHWVWIAPWGWTWVDDARWGYAPFHYGRWARYATHWCWVPGPRRGRPVYAPALVGWVGGAAHRRGALPAGGGVGWFPLGPREVYVPSYQVSQAYVRRVNITNTTIVNNLYITNVYQRNLRPLHYVNNTVAAVTVVPQNVFTSGQRVGGHSVRLPAATLEGAEVTAAAPAIAPIRQSVLGPALGSWRRAAAGGAAQPAGHGAHAAADVRPAPLERQLAAIQANGGRPLARADLAGLQPAAPATAVRMVATAGPVVNAAALPRGPLPGRPGIAPSGFGGRYSAAGAHRARACPAEQPRHLRAEPAEAIHRQRRCTTTGLMCHRVPLRRRSSLARRPHRRRGAQSIRPRSRRGHRRRSAARWPRMTPRVPPAVRRHSRCSGRRAPCRPPRHPPRGRHQQRRHARARPNCSRASAPPSAPQLRVAPAVVPSHGGAPARVNEPDPRGAAAHGDRSSRDRAER